MIHRERYGNSVYWKFWIFTGLIGRYVDVDFNFWIVRGFLHIQYGPDNRCKKPAHR